MERRMTVTPETSAETSRAERGSWHGLSADEVSARLGVDPTSGLDAAEVAKRLALHGPNKLAEAPKEPGWHAFLRQYRDLMQYVLVGAAIISMAALQEFGTGVAILGITVVNAILGLNQEGKAAESIAALQKMLIIKAHVRRGGELADIPAEELVPGDVVSFEAGDKIPAAGRLLVAALEAREPTETIFTRYTIANRRFVQLIGAALVLTFLVTALRPLRRIFDTVALSSSQWAICLIGPIVFVALAELGKLIDRRRAPHHPAPAVAEA